MCRPPNLKWIWIPMLLLVSTACGFTPGDQADRSPSPPPPSRTPVQASPAPPVEEPTSTSEPALAPPPEHRIGVRTTGSVGEFYDRLTGERFVPRGNNYIHLAPMSASDRNLWHSTLSPGFYDPSAAEAALEQMHADGYNVVRVFLDCCRDGNNLGDPQGGLSSAYLDVVMDFLARAKANEIYVQLDLSLTPGDGGYNNVMWAACNQTFQSDNCRYMTRGGLEAKRHFVRDVVQALITRSAPLDFVFAYQLENEMFFDGQSPPLSLSSGVARPANGEAYDLGSPEDKERMMEDAVAYFIDTLRADILALDPTALVTIGFFPPDVPPLPVEPRWPRTRSAVWNSTADFIDFHLYPGGHSLDKLVDNLGMAGHETKPIIMGELGAARYSFPTATGAAMALHDWQVASCGYGFDGWLLWTWDAHEQLDFYNGLADGGPINQALAPVNRPDPCQPGSFPFFERNLALDKPVQASRSLPGLPPSRAVNADFGDQWSSGAFPRQWIEIDLGSPTHIRIIRLHVTQSPPGQTTHQIWVGTARADLSVLHVFKDFTASGQILEWRSQDQGETVRYVRVVTTKSPSWVGWNEIEIIGP